MNVKTIEIEHNGIKRKPLLLDFVKTEIKPILFYKSVWKELFNNCEMKKLYLELFTSFALMILFKINSFVNSCLQGSIQISQKLNNLYKQLFSFTFRLVSKEEDTTSKTATIYNSYNNINANYLDYNQSNRISFLNTLIINN